MATLNTLRTRGGVIVSVVIGVALLAFLLGDFGNSGANMMNERKMRVGEIDGEKIGYTRFADQVDYLTNVMEFRMGGNSLTSEQQDQVRDMAWNSLIAEYALQPGMKEAGIAISEDEQTDMVAGAYISPVVRATFVNPNTGSFDAALLRTFVANLGQDYTGRSAQFWNYVKEQMVNERLISKYETLVAQGMYVTDLEVEQAVADAGSSNAISYTMKGYDQVPDSLVTVSESEVRKYYDEHKDVFRQTAARDIEYVVFDVLPSEADYAEAQKTVDEMAAEFAVSETPLQYAMLNSHDQPDKQYVSESQLPKVLADFAFGNNGESMYGPVREGDLYTMARVADAKMLPDSVGARHILIASGETELADSIVKALKGGASFGELALQYSMDQGANARQGDLGIFSPSQMVPEFSEAVVKTPKGEIFTVETQFGLHIGEVTYKSAPVKKVQMATITYRIEPSETTQQTVYADASKFIAEAAASYDAFNRAVDSSALSKRVSRIRNTDRNVNGIDNSREIVRWAFNGQKGDVSSIVEVNGNYVVAAITGVTEDGIAPVQAVSNQIANTLRFEKKGELIAKEMADAPSVAEAASKLGTEVKEAADIEFNSFFISGIGVEPKLIGAVTGAKENTVSKPVTGGVGVYLFDVTSRTPVETVTPESEKVRLEANAKAYISERINQALISASEITDNRVKFF